MASVLTPRVPPLWHRQQQKQLYLHNQAMCEVTARPLLRHWAPSLKLPSKARQWTVPTSPVCSPCSCSLVRKAYHAL